MPGRHPNLTRLALAVGSLVLAWTGAEGIAWLALRQAPAAAPEASSDSRLYALDQDPVYGYQLPAGAEHVAVKTKPDGGICYRAAYRTDRYRRRSLSQSPRPGRPHLLLFGCSVTMGEGLDDHDTLQYWLGEDLPDVDVADYAVHGWGPTHALAKLRSGELKQQVGSATGAAVYFLIPAHISRVIGDTRTFWLFDAPSYDLGADGNVEGGLSFRRSHPWRVLVYEALLAAKRHSWLLTAVHAELPFAHDDADLELTASVLAEARRSYREQFHGEFLVAFHPTWDLSSDENRGVHDRMLVLLEKRGVPVLDYASERVSPDDVIDPSCDWHPNGKLNRRLALRLSDELFARAPGVAGPAPGSLVLVYHRIAADPSVHDAETVPLADFQAQMEELVRRGLRTVTVSGMYDAMQSGDTRSAAGAVAIIFDDGWKSQALALPVLRRLDLKASFAIFPGLGIGIDYFEWSDVEAIAADPRFEILSHSMTHPWNRKENLVTWAEGKSTVHGSSDVDAEIRDSKRILEERLRRPVAFFAWPCGWYNADLVGRALAAGYKGLLSIEAGTNAAGDDPAFLKRVMVDGRCSMEQFRDILDHHRYPDCASDGPLGHQSRP